MQQKKIVVILSHERSGSSYLGKLIEQFDDVCFLKELFHTNPKTSIEPLKKIINNFGELEESAKSQSKSLLKYFQTEPVKLLEMVKVEQDVLAFKLFPRQLDEQASAELLKRADIVIQLNRNIVHSYISFVIAKESGKWEKTNTSGKKVFFDGYGFVCWNNVISHFFSKALKKVDKAKLVVLDYEKFIMSNSPLEAIRELLAVKGIELSSVPQNADVGLVKQDKRSLATDKVTNPKELSSILKRYSLVRLNDSNETMIKRNELSANTQMLTKLVCLIRNKINV